MLLVSAILVLAITIAGFLLIAAAQMMSTTGTDGPSPWGWLWGGLAVSGALFGSWWAWGGSAVTW